VDAAVDEYELFDRSRLRQYGADGGGETYGSGQPHRDYSLAR